jgi:hypothetical protein
MNTKLFIAMLATLAIAACDSSTSSNNPDNGGLTSVTGLHGSILDPNGKGIPNAKVRLKSTGATATTDADGKWSLSVSAARAVAGRTFDATDSIVISKDSQVIVAKPVTSYNVELPPLYVVQRDVFGTLLNAPIGKALQVSAVINMPDSTKYLLNFWYNKASANYSKFFYLVSSDSIQTYLISLVVRDSLGDTISKSKTPMEFTTEAGDVQMLPIRYNNYVPVFTFNKDSLIPTVIGTGRHIVKLKLDSSNYSNDVKLVEWRLANDTNWVNTASATRYQFNTEPLVDPKTLDYTYAIYDSLKRYNRIVARVTLKNNVVNHDTTKYFDN